MNNIPRQQLYQLIATYGHSLCDDPRRCEALLKDLCAQYRPEVAVLVGALKEKVAAELLASQKNMPQTVLLARLTKRIRENLALTEDAAKWAVESWALALGAIPNTNAEPKPELPEKTVSLLSAIGVSTQILTPPSKLKQRRLLIGASITTIAIGALGIYALYRQPGTSSLEQLKAQNADGNYQGCVDRATAIPQTSHIYPAAQNLLQQCQLSLAKQLAANSNFAGAISEAAKIPQNAVEYQQAQQHISQWSNSMLEIAKNRYQSGNLNDAITIAKTIPESSSVYPKAQGTIQQWNQEWQQNQSYLEAAQKALNEEKWQTAISEANKVTDNFYWQERKEPIIQKAESQIAAPRSAVANQPQRKTVRTPVGITLRGSIQTTSKASRTASRTRRTTSTLPSRKPPKPLPRKFSRPSRRTVITPNSSVPRRPNNPTKQPCRNWQQRVQQRGANSGCS